MVRYLSGCAEYLFRNVGASRIGELENELLEVLSQHGNEMALTELTKKTRRFDADERGRLLDIMEGNRQIVRFNEQTGGSSEDDDSPCILIADFFVIFFVICK